LTFLLEQICLEGEKARHRSCDRLLSRYSSPKEMYLSKLFADA